MTVQDTLLLAMAMLDRQKLLLIQSRHIYIHHSCCAWCSCCPQQQCAGDGRQLHISSCLHTHLCRCTIDCNLVDVQVEAVQAHAALRGRHQHQQLRVPVTALKSSQVA